MNISRRALMFGVAAVAIAPVAINHELAGTDYARRLIGWDLASGPDKTAIWRWHPNPAPMFEYTSPLAELYYGGARGGGMR